jgi:hypothetical protein
MWALGELHADDPDPRLTETILGRLTGDPGMGRDDPRVRAMVPVAMVRMKAKGTLATLKEHTEGDKPTLNVVLHAARWAVAQMEGKPAPTPEVVKVPQNDWFLVPHK